MPARVTRSMLRCRTGPSLPAMSQTIRDIFEAEYRRLFERHIPNAAIEIMSWSVAVSTARSRRPAISEVAMGEVAVPSGRRAVLDGRLGALVEAALYERAALSPGHRIEGPAIVVEDGTSTLIASSFDAHVDSAGALVLTMKETR